MFLGVLALMVRFGTLAVLDKPTELFHLPDSAEYDRLGWNLAERGQYSLAEHEPWSPDLTRTPIFPLFVAGCYRLLGHAPVGVVVMQIILSIITSLLVYEMGYRYVGHVAALTSAILLILDPLTNHYSTLLLSETLFTLLLTVSLACLLLYLTKPNFSYAALTAVSTGLTVLCRPIAVFWPLLVGMLMLLFGWRHKRWQALVHVTLFCFLTMGQIGSWILRNQWVGGVPVLSTVQGINLYYHRAAVLLAEQEQISIDEARLRLREQLKNTEVNESLDPRQEYDRMEKAAREVILASPWKYIRLHVQGARQLFSPQDKTPPWTTDTGHWIEVVFLFVLYSLALAGLLQALRYNCFPALLLVLIIIYFTVLSGPEAYPRFRVPMMPAISLLAGLGLSGLAQLLFPSSAPNLHTTLSGT